MTRASCVLAAAAAAGLGSLGCGGDDVTDGGDGGLVEGTWLTFEGSDDVELRAAAAAADGSIWLTGCFGGDLVLGETTLAGDGTYTAFVAKLAPDGSVSWAKEFRGASTGDVFDRECGEELLMTAGGGAIVAGTYDDPIDFGLGSLSAGDDGDVFLVSLDDAGEARWSQGFHGGEGDAEDGVVALAQDGAGAIYVYGDTLSEDLAVGDVVVEENSSFLAKLDADGTALWSEQVTRGRRGSGGAVAVGPEGQAYVSLSFDGELELSEGVVTPVVYDVALIGMGSDGQVSWQQVWSGDAIDVDGVLTVADDGSVLMAGEFSSSDLQIGTTTLSAADASNGDLYVTRVGADGTVSWATRTDGHTVSDLLWTGGELAVAGFTASNLGDGRMGLPFVARFDGSGAPLGREEVEVPQTGAPIALLPSAEGGSIMAAQLGVSEGGEFDRLYFGLTRLD